MLTIEVINVFFKNTICKVLFFNQYTSAIQTLTIYSYHYTLKPALKVVRHFPLVKTCMIYLPVRKCQEKKGNFLFLENYTKWTTPGRVNDTVTWWRDIAYIVWVSSFARYKGTLIWICRYFGLHIKTTRGRFLITTLLSFWDIVPKFGLHEKNKAYIEK